MPHALLYPGDPLAEHKSEILDWIEAVIVKKIPRDLPFEEVLKDGVILCNMINVLIPGCVKRIAKKGSNLQLMENHAAFQKGMKKFGVPDDEIFQTVDLFEARNVKQVVKSLAALARIASEKPNYDGPQMSPKSAVLFQWEVQELATEASAGTSKLNNGSGQSTSQVNIHVGNQQTIQD